MVETVSLTLESPALVERFAETSALGHSHPEEIVLALSDLDHDRVGLPLASLATIIRAFAKPRLDAAAIMPDAA